jgi:hypothetical protein
LGEGWRDKTSPDGEEDWVYVVGLELLVAHFSIDKTVYDAIPKEKAVIVPR